MSTRWKLGLVMWGAGVIGVVALGVLVLPGLIARLPEILGREMPPLPFPMWGVILANLVQTSMLVALAVWAGVALAPGVGLRAPAFEAAVSRGASVGDALRPQLMPGLVAGIVGGFVLAGASRLAPPEVQAAQGRLAFPLLVRVTYGGITEELLLRWGFMTVLVWLAWRFFSRTEGWVWVAIVASAIVFAVGHLPAAAMIVGLTPGVIGYVLVANAFFGIVFGVLYRRFGLEAAIVAHAITHVVAFLVKG